MFAFSLLALIMVIGALGVISLRQPVHAALSLVATLLTLAVTYVTLEAHFLAAIQVIVYAGAIMVLFLFVIMLLNVQGETSQDKLAWIKPAGFIVGLFAAAGIASVAVQNPSTLPDAATIQAALQGGGAAQIGEALFSEFVLAFQLVGVLLLTGTIGAVSLVQRKAQTTPTLQTQAATSAPAVAVTTPQPVAVAATPAPQDTARAETPDQTTAKSRAEQADKTQEKPDDLKRIKGIGPKLEGLLHRNGITRFEQLANLTETEIQELDAQLEEFKGRIERENWISQAKELELEKRQA